MQVTLYDAMTNSMRPDVVVATAKYLNLIAIGWERRQPSEKVAILDDVQRGIDANRIAIEPMPRRKA